MQKTLIMSIIFLLCLHSKAFGSVNSKSLSISRETDACIGCHSSYTPGIVEDWLLSRHSRTSPEDALKLPLLSRRISAESISDGLRKNIVGCYECHGLNPEAHKENFEHFGFRINVVVSPNDCKTCHPVEVSQFSESKKAHAIKNLMDKILFITPLLTRLMVL